MMTCRVAVVLLLMTTALPIASAAPATLSPADRAVLADYARDTWRSIAALADHGVLPVDSMRETAEGWVADGFTSPTNIAAYLWSVVAAEDLGLITRDEASRRLGQTLSTLAQLERAEGFFFNWYDPVTGRRARVWSEGGEVRPFLSVVDNGWLAAALMVVAHARPEFRDSAESLLAPMNFGFFYNAYDPSDPVRHPGLLRGGYWADDGTFADYHYGTLNTEPRIASYIGIARGDLPAEHYYRMYRVGADPRPEPALPAASYVGVPVVEETLNYRGIELVPTWDGTMFEALMVPLFVPESDWAPRSWGVNHPLYVQAQIEFGLRDAQLGYWGWSAASTPGGGYSAYGVAPLGVRTYATPPVAAHDSVVTPYASFLALPFMPVEALANLKALATNFPIYGAFGFRDSVDVRTGAVSDRVLVLDQGMILAALSNVIGNDVLRRGFSEGMIEAAIRPLIALEQFDARLDPTSIAAQPFSPPAEPELALATAPATPAEPLDEPPAPAPDHADLRQHLVAGFLILGVSAMMALRARQLRGQRPTPVLSSLDRPASPSRPLA